MNEPRPFATEADWWAWLADHPDEREIWVLYHRKGAGVESIDWEQAVVGAIAHGWIDGIRKTVNATQWTQRFTPRKPTSAWSQKNIDTAERLITAGQMTAAGLATVTQAKAAGRWEMGYSGGKGAALPQDFLDALAAAPQLARDTFAGLKTQSRYAIYYRLTTAKRPETRAKRMADFLTKLAAGLPIP